MNTIFHPSILCTCTLSRAISFINTSIFLCNGRLKMAIDNRQYRLSLKGCQCCQTTNDDFTRGKIFFNYFYSIYDNFDRYHLSSACKCMLEMAIDVGQYDFIYKFDVKVKSFTSLFHNMNAKH